MTMFSKKIALIALVGLIAVGTFFVPSAEARDRYDRYDNHRGWSDNRGHHNGWRNRDNRRECRDRGPRHSFWGGRDDRRYRQAYGGSRWNNRNGW